MTPTSPHLKRKRLLLRHLTPDWHRLLFKAGQLMINMDDDPDYLVAVDYDLKTGRMGGEQAVTN